MYMTEDARNAAVDFLPNFLLASFASFASFALFAVNFTSQAVPMRGMCMGSRLSSALSHWRIRSDFTAS